jgi:hypothetical protein
VLAIATLAVADPGEIKPKPYDIKALKDHMQVFQDAHGGTYVVAMTDTESLIFYGTGKTLYVQVDSTKSRNGDAWSIRAWSPRMPIDKFAGYGYVERIDDGTFRKVCGGKDDSVLTQLTGDKAKQVLDKYSFVTTALIREPKVLARDDSGVYYYVDQLAEVYGGKGFRVFVGKKGAMKQLPLTDVASDTGGDVFSTKTGNLRLVRNVNQTDEAEIVWVKSEKRTPLKMLDTYMNMQLIYSELGLYTFIGSLCENGD